MPTAARTSSVRERRHPGRRRGRVPVPGGARPWVAAVRLASGSPRTGLVARVWRPDTDAARIGGDDRPAGEVGAVLEQDQVTNGRLAAGREADQPPNARVRQRPNDGQLAEVLVQRDE